MRKKKILLVDADKPVQETLVDLLRMDYAPISFQKGEDGLNYLSENVGEIDLVIMDLMLPEMDGFEMLESIQKNPLYKGIPVLVVTTAERTQDIRRVYDLGVDDIIIKPINPDIVRQRVRNMLDAGDARRVHNVMEDLIWMEIEENIADLGICPCPICRKDLLTLTLNHVTPKYVTTEKGEIITKAGSLASRNERIKLLAEITRYTSRIKEKPRH